jgi:phosphoenolpyruvate-protein kinase (PTS system EI component)
VVKDYNIKGLCSLYGSTLSHPSVLSREFNIPFVINIALPDTVTTGSLIEISESGELKLLIDYNS